MLTRTTQLIPVAAGVLIPIGIQMNPILASGAIAVSITVLSNSLLLRRWKPRDAL